MKRAIEFLVMILVLANAAARAEVGNVAANGTPYNTSPLSVRENGTSIS